MAITAGTFIEREDHAPLAEAAGGIATIVLAILALANVAEPYLVPINAILFGAVLLVYGTSTMFEFKQGAGKAATGGRDGSGLSALLLAGAAGIVLGILGLLGMHTDTLIAVSVIVYGAAMMLSGSASAQLHAFADPGGREMLAGCAGLQALGGLTAIALGLLSLTGTNPAVLIMVAFLVLGAVVVLSPATLSRMGNQA